MTSVLTTVVSFLPVFGLSATELRLFAPLAFTKTFAMMSALLLALCVLPAAALVVMRQRPVAPSGKHAGIGRLARSLFRSEHLRDWVMVGLGLLLLRYSLVGGLVVLLLGLYRLARPLLTTTADRRFELTENIVCVVAVSLLLAEDWLPLGAGEGLTANVLFVGALIVSVMGTFRLFEVAYPSLLRWILKRKLLFLALPASVVVFGVTAWLGFATAFGFLPRSILASQPVSALAHALPGFGREYMPPFDEGSFLYMPTTMPHASIGEVLGMLSEMDAAIAQIPEVDRVVGKLGRVDSALDPAPLSMIETVITYKPEYRAGADGSRERQWRDHIRTPRDIWDEIVKAAQRPGVTSAPTLMPISARIVMLQSGMRAPMGIKVHGPSLEVIEGFGLELEKILRTVPSVRPETVFADRVVGKPYLEIDIDREAIGRYGLTVIDVQNVLQVALGGTTLTRTVEGRERYPVRVRYMREERDSLETLARIFVPTPGGAQIPLTQLADIQYVRGPQVIKSENTFLTSYVLFDRQGERAEVETVQQARHAIQGAIDQGQLSVPAGVSFQFSGSYENQVRSEQRLMLLIPLALTAVFILLYLQFHQVSVSIMIYTGSPWRSREASACCGCTLSRGFSMSPCWGRRCATCSRSERSICPSPSGSASLRWWESRRMTVWSCRPSSSSASTRNRPGTSRMFAQGPLRPGRDASARA